MTRALFAIGIAQRTAAFELGPSPARRRTRRAAARSVCRFRDLVGTADDQDVPRSHARPSAAIRRLAAVALAASIATTASGCARDQDRGKQYQPPTPAQCVEAWNAGVVRWPDGTETSTRDLGFVATPVVVAACDFTFLTGNAVTTFERAEFSFDDAGRQYYRFDPHPSEPTPTWRRPTDGDEGCQTADGTVHLSADCAPPGAGVRPYDIDAGINNGLVRRLGMPAWWLGSRWRAATPRVYPRELFKLGHHDFEAKPIATYYVEDPPGSAWTVLVFTFAGRFDDPATACLEHDCTIENRDCECSVFGVAHPAPGATVVLAATPGSPPPVEIRDEALRSLLPAAERPVR